MRSPRLGTLADAPVFIDGPERCIRALEKCGDCFGGEDVSAPAQRVYVRDRALEIISLAVDPAVEVLVTPHHGRQGEVLYDARTRGLPFAFACVARFPG